MGNGCCCGAANEHAYKSKDLVPEIGSGSAGQSRRVSRKESKTRLQQRDLPECTTPSRQKRDKRSLKDSKSGKQEQLVTHIDNFLRKHEVKQGLIFQSYHSSLVESYMCVSLGDFEQKILNSVQMEDASDREEFELRMERLR